MSKNSFVTVKEASKLLSLSINCVMEFIEKGKLRFEIRKMDKAPFRNIRYIPLSDVEQLKNDRSVYGQIPSGFITCESAANYFGFHSTTIRAMAYDHKINSISSTNSHGQPTLYIEAASLENYISERADSKDLVDRFFVANLLNVDPGTVQRWARRNRIPYLRVKRLGKGLDEHRLYPRKQIEELIRSTQTPPNISDDFGYYFSGLSDGEGSFLLFVRNRPQNTSNEAAFKISLRGDDLPILISIRKSIGFGSLYVRRNNLGRHVVSLDFSRHADAIRLVHIFDKYPLRAKKARDYAIWREFVLERSKPDFSQERLKQLADEIVKVRDYQPPTPELTAEAKRLNDDLPFHFKGLGIGLHP